MLLDGNTVNVGIAYLGGLASFFAPCVAPVLPGYMAYLAGHGASEGKNKRRLIWHVLLFCLGFLVIFVLLGLVATSVGAWFAVHKEMLARIGGVLMVLLGLMLLNAIPIKGLYRERRMRLPFTQSGTALTSFALGLTFGFAWSPCIGPVLAVILLWASQADTAVQGVSLLLVYGLGLATPFLLTGLFVERLLPLVKRSARLQKGLHLVSGIVIILFGLLLATGLLGVVLAPLTHIGSLELLFID